ncbi:putative flippase GtrA [Saccharopolyspora lacisalsi]|uniref:Putative flippase GtrA n=1 Tax=Halosaccharopolyspora lacisalsi TaxID=1000566 RepID=A0A839E9G9_9PSEU|nr:GtrA family protein [Halosaccharopolyspora lacisalsi]MBA8827488.1 putative flippase GtrA [Halosaccharopolyspora lacisalsi]
MTTTDEPESDVPAMTRPPLVSKQLVLYALLGGFGVVLDYLLFLLLFNVAGLHEQLANAISISAGITSSFTLNTLFNFRKRDRLLTRFVRFYAVGMGGIALTFVLLAVFAGPVGLDPNLVKLGSLPLVLIFQYTLNKKWSFG